MAEYSRQPERRRITGSEPWQAFWPELLVMGCLFLILAVNAASVSLDPTRELPWLLAVKQALHPVLHGSAQGMTDPLLWENPLLTILAALAVKAGGPSLWVVRLLSVAFALAGLILTYVLSQRMFGNRWISTFALAALGCSLNYLWAAHHFSPDLLGGVVLCAFFTWLWDWEHSASQQRRNTTPQQGFYAPGFGMLLAFLFWSEGAGLFLIILTLLVLYAVLTASWRMVSLLLSPRCLMMFAGVLFLGYVTMPLLFGVSPLAAISAFHLPGIHAVKVVTWSQFWMWVTLGSLPLVVFLVPFLVELFFHKETQKSVANDRPALLFLLLWLVVGLLTAVFVGRPERPWPGALLTTAWPLALASGMYVGRWTMVKGATALTKLSLDLSILILTIFAVFVTVFLFEVLPDNYPAGFWESSAGFLAGPPVLTDVLGVALANPFPLWKLWLLPIPLFMLVLGIVLLLLVIRKLQPYFGLVLTGGWLLLLIYIKLILFPILHRPVIANWVAELNKACQAGTMTTVVVDAEMPLLNVAQYYLTCPVVPIHEGHEWLALMQENPDTPSVGLMAEAHYYQWDSGLKRIFRAEEGNWEWHMNRPTRFVFAAHRWGTLFRENQTRLVRLRYVPEMDAEIPAAARQ
ncbi:MAG: ArnT family glycosyltransferase [Candidatus Melainabacteria bacterium]